MATLVRKVVAQNAKVIMLLPRYLSQKHVPDSHFRLVKTFPIGAPLFSRVSWCDPAFPRSYDWKTSWLVDIWISIAAVKSSTGSHEVEAETSTQCTVIDEIV